MLEVILDYCSFDVVDETAESRVNVVLSCRTKAETGKL